MKTLSLVIFLTLSLNAHAVSTFYPQEFVKTAQSKSVRDQDLKDQIYDLLTLGHTKDSNGGADKLGCDSTASNCSSHVNLGYEGARKILFGRIHLKTDSSGYYIEDVYCNKKFGGNLKVGPNAIPNQDKINCEHTWPQSKFSGQFSKDLQKADLHHLYPTDSRANSIRGNLEFADVASDDGSLAQDDCTISKFGTSVLSGGDFFEPPTHHKGNVARALFYFSVRYKLPISKNQESFLRKWNELDPPDQDEINRNEIIYQAQHDRNPFIDFPELANQISDF